MRWRDYGPWTDLYAFGCMAYKLCTSRYPFRGQGLIAIGVKHMHEPPPPLEPGFPVPAGFDDWISVLLSKSPADRYRSAAEAAFELEQLGPGGADDQGDPSMETLRVGSANLAALFRGATTAEMATHAEHSDTEIGLPAPLLDHLPPPRGGVVSRCPPLPLDWRPHEEPPRRPWASLGLCELRPPSFVGREEERERLWTLLGAAIARKQPRAVLLAGKSGSGRTRLARWLGVRASELGGALALEAQHSPAGGARHGFGPMVARYFSVEGLSDEEAVYAQISERLLWLGVDAERERDALARGLVAIVVQGDDPRGGGGTWSVQFASREERYATLLEFLRIVSATRPVVLCLHNLQWGLDGICFLRFLLGAAPGHPTPVLVVGGIQPDALGERHAERDALGLLPEVPQIPVGPLDAESQEALVRDLVGEDGPLAARLLAHTGGHPLFAVQLVADWIEQGQLVATPFGLQLHERTEPPGSLEGLSDGRVDRLFRRLSGPERVALMAAAALGEGVDAREWAAVCQRLGSQATPHLVERLAEAGLVEEGRHGWSFRTASFRAALVRRSRASGSWARINRACASAVLESAGAGCPMERHATHLLSAGADDEAVAPLYRAALERFEVGDYTQAEVILGRREEALERLLADPGDPRFGEGKLLRVRVALVQSLARARTLLEEVERDTLVHRWSALAPQLAELRGRICLAAGDLLGASTHLSEAESLLEATGPVALLAHCRRDLGHALLATGDPEGAQRLVSRALEMLRQQRDLGGEARCELVLADIARRSGDREGAGRHLGRARRRFAASSARLGVAHCARLEADLARIRGQHRTAARLYAEAIDRFEQIGAQSVELARLGLALLQTAEGHLEEAHALFSEALEALEGNGLRAGLATATAGLCLLAARNGAWGELQERLDATEQLLARAGVADPDALDSLRATEIAATAAGRHELAVRAAALVSSSAELLEHGATLG